MDVKKLSADFSVTAQLDPKDLPLVHSLGFKSVLCNRPDGEEASQPLFASIEKAAALAGLQSAFAPVERTGPDAASIAAFRNALESLPKPVLAYCRTGGRSTASFNAA